MSQPPLAGAPQPVGQEIAVLVAEDDIRDDLGLIGVLLRLPAWLEAIVPSDPGHQLVQPLVAEALPLAVGEECIAGNDEHFLAGSHGPQFTAGIARLPLASPTRDRRESHAGAESDAFWDRPASCRACPPIAFRARFQPGGSR